MTNAGGGRGMESFPPENFKLFLFFSQFLVDLVHPAYSSCEILNARAGQLELRLTKP